MKRSLFALAFVLAGCGGSPFTETGRQEDDGGVAGAVNAAGGASGAKNAAGGATVVETDAGSGGSGGSAEEQNDSGSGGSVAAGGSMATGGVASDACALATHDDGTGQSWQDCTPFGTHNNTQATRACETWCVGKSGCSCFVGSICSSEHFTDYIVGSVPGSPVVEMGWSGSADGVNDAGNVVSVMNPANGGFLCNQIGKWN